MTLVQLRHLLSLSRTGSFSQSASALFLTQPALSRSIKALESELGRPLFDRIGRHSELTPFGREVVEQAQALVLAAEDLRDLGRRSAADETGTLRVGMGSGPGSLLMTPLLLKAARDRPRLQVEIARAGTELLVQALRERRLDALVVDLRSLQPAADLHTRSVHEMRGAFMVRPGHALTERAPGQSLGFDTLRTYPIASTPLSDEVARRLVERYGPQAHPADFVTLRCEEITSLVDVTRRSDTVLLAIRAAAPDLVELRLDPALDATARFGLVTLARRSDPAGLALLRELMDDLLHEPPA
ncbi:MAG: hypothetical protein RIQ60_2032 [Pseudomonadota bacterium]|jgi:DNA-binding transcriptional LysR family regulator